MLNVKKLVLSVICVMVLVSGIFGVRYLISVDKYKKTVKELVIGSVDLSKISDGKYIGSCDVDFVAAKVEVIVKNNKISSIILLSHKTGKGKPAEVITQNVIEAQNLQVDAISGATNSSKVILKSIENALKAGES